MSEKIHYHGYSIRLQPGVRDEYIRYHQNVWKEVEDTMHKAGVVEYRIFITGDDQLFSVIGFREGCDMASFVKENEKVEACCRWDELMSPMQKKCDFAKETEWWAELPMVYDLNKE